MEILQTTLKNTSTDFRPNLSTNYITVEVVGVLLAYLCSRGLLIPIKLQGASKAYEIFDKKEDVTKVLLKP